MRGAALTYEGGGDFARFHNPFSSSISIPPGDAGGDRATVIDFRNGPRLSRMVLSPLGPMPRPAAARAAAIRADIVDRKSTWSSSGESGGGAGTGL